MLKNNLPILFLLLLASCTKPSSPKLLISAFEKNASSVVERKLAAAPDGKCVKDIFSVDLLKAEVKELEKNYSGSPVKGKWKHLDLSKLPISQANFLKRYGDKLGDQTGKNPVDYSGCEDVPCIYNKIYEQDNNVAGYVHYLWYLKFNHMLSADNHVPADKISKAGIYQGKAQELVQYLYTRDELYGLWRLSLMLKTSHNKIPNLDEVQRIPRGEAFEGASVGACGLAYSQGHILLQDGCLTIYKQADMDTGHLYAAVAHELSHMMDFNAGISTPETYRKMTGFLSSKEYLNEKNERVQEWILDPAIKHISSYAKTSPMESYAETMAYMRTDGEGTKDNIAENLKAWISKNYYASKRFDRESLMEVWLKKHSVDISKESLKAVVDCSSQKSVPVPSNFFKSSDFEAKLIPSTLNCLGARAQDISKIISARISIQEPEGCRNLMLTGGKEAWEKNSRKELSSYLSRFLKELESDKDYVARINTFYDELSNKESARMAYLNCYGQLDEQACYETEIDKLMMNKAKLLRLPESHTQELVELYSTYHPYPSVKEESGSLYVTFVESNRAAIRIEAAKLFKTCLEVPHNDDVPPRDVLFKMGNGYLISSVYNCLSERIPDSIQNIERSIAVGEMKIEHPNEEIILTKEISPLIKYELETIYEANLEKERVDALSQSTRIKKDVRASLLSNFDWVSDILDSKKIADSCRSVAMVRIDYLPIYHLKKDLFSEIILDSICASIEATPEYNQYLDASKTTLIKKSQDSMESKLADLAQRRALACVKQFPVDTNLNRVKFKKDREACLIDIWPAMESEVLKGFSDQPIAKKFNLTDAIFIERFNQSRRKMQLKIFKDSFSGP